MYIAIVNINVRTSHPTRRGKVPLLRMTVAYRFSASTHFIVGDIANDIPSLAIIQVFGSVGIGPVYSLFV